MNIHKNNLSFVLYEEFCKYHNVDETDQDLCNDICEMVEDWADECFNRIDDFEYEEYLADREEFLNS